MSVLAHVVLKGSLPGEPAATQALAHILNASSDSVQHKGREAGRSLCR